MKEFLESIIAHPISCILLTLILFFLFIKGGSLIKINYIQPLFNPILLTALSIMALFLYFKLDLKVYRENIKEMEFFLPLATILMAVNVYRNRGLLRKYFFVIIISVGVGSFISVVLLPILAIKVFSLKHIFIIPSHLKSITSAFGLEIAAGLDPQSTSLTLLAILITGISGAIFLPFILSIFHLKGESISWGIATGSSSHIVGTAKALEINKQAGSIASVSLAIAGLWSVLFMKLFY